MFLALVPVALAVSLVSSGAALHGRAFLEEVCCAEIGLGLLVGVAVWIATYPIYFLGPKPAGAAIVPDRNERDPVDFAAALVLYVLVLKA
jgi:hypothetical protein